jgi:hypothetical protein
MAFAPSARARHSLAPPHRSGRETFHDAAGFASCYGPHRRSPSFRAFDAGLRPRPFPDEAASLLPGPLAATRTGLPPAGDDELTNKIHRYITASPPALLGARCGTRVVLAATIQGASQLQRQSDLRAHGSNESDQRQRAATPSFIHPRAARQGHEGLICDFRPRSCATAGFSPGRWDG